MEFYIYLTKHNDASNDFTFNLPSRLYFPGGQWKCGLVEATLTRKPPNYGVRIETDFVDTTIISHKKRQMLRHVTGYSIKPTHVMYMRVIVTDTQQIKIQIVDNNTDNIFLGQEKRITRFCLHFKQS